MAVSLYSRIKGSKNRGKEVIINKPDINETECFSLDDLSYTNERDYYKSGIKVCQDEGLQFSVGFDVEVTSNIPLQAGCSSSSSIMVGWIHFLSQMADEPINWQPDKIAQLAYQAEAVEFGSEINLACGRLFVSTTRRSFSPRPKMPYTLTSPA